jgi:hypothetical protein
MDDRFDMPGELGLCAAQMDEREEGIARREIELSRRERAADERERVADERDRIADDREQTADDRELQADIRGGCDRRVNANDCNASTTGTSVGKRLPGGRQPKSGVPWQRPGGVSTTSTLRRARGRDLATDLS